MSYASIDPAIRAWVARHGFTLFDSIQDIPKETLRAVYVSGEQGECFQIWIDQPESDQVSLHAAGVETRDDEEMQQDWSVPVSELDEALERALAHVQRWIGR